jgi:dihydrolipoamide dehydrogenase
MVLEKQPDSMIIIGAGAIGVEFAYIYNTFGTNVTIVETQANLLPAEDSEVSGAITNSYRKEGITCLTNSTVTSANDYGCSVRLTVQGPGGEKELSADCCLVAIGVSPVIPNGEKPDLTERGWIKVDRNFQTSIPRVYAIGDVSGPPWLAHIASYEATQCVDGIFVEGARIRPLVNFPSCTYSYPEVASVGKTEQVLKNEGIPYKSSKFPYQALGKAHTESLNEGFIKLLACEETNQLLGAHIIGSNATEIISEMCLAISRAASLDQVKNTIHPLPSFSEGIHEAALGINGQPIHC